MCTSAHSTTSWHTDQWLDTLMNECQLDRHDKKLVPLKGCTQLLWYTKTPFIVIGDRQSQNLIPLAQNLTKKKKILQTHFFSEIDYATWLHIFRPLPVRALALLSSGASALVSVPQTLLCSASVPGRRRHLPHSAASLCRLVAAALCSRWLLRAGPALWSVILVIDHSLSQSKNQSVSPSGSSSIEKSISQSVNELLATAVNSGI